ncbi:MAG TPA: pyruvate dehydrogenase (acetyl-transferring) E1 component subunit alpha, partial [Ideonella sp.]|nr:pyruvate dehydrogenase (acetyl-transferring) E1 component subunit alpha [Ideonella sp.]
EWVKRDPVVLQERRLRAAGLVDDAGFAALEAEVAREVEEAVAFAEAGTWEPIETLTRDVMTPGVSS